MHDKLVQQITEESIRRVKAEREEANAKIRERVDAKKTSSSLVTASGKGSPMKSESTRQTMDMESK